MKREGIHLRALLFAALVALMLPAQAFAVSQAEKTLYKEGVDAFLELVQPRGIGQYYVQEGYSDLTVWSPDGPAPAVEKEGYAAQVYYTVKMRETNGVGFTIEDIRLFSYAPWGNISAGKSADLSKSDKYIEPYGEFSFKSGCPRNGNYRYEIIVVTGTDDNGHELEFYGVAERMNFIAQTGGATASVTADNLRDTANLRHNADYEVEVADGVWWVPAAALGESGYTNSEIAEMAPLSPEEKQQNVSTLYEALQLFQIGVFADANDNQRIEENGVMWEHHKPGYHAVRTNEGCCASDSNWLNYILRGDYEEVGFMAYSQSDGGGHIFNYLCMDGYWYFIDLTHYRLDFLEASAPETGVLSDYHNSDYIAGNVHKAMSPESFVSYFRQAANDPPELFFLYQAEDCLPVDGVRGADGVCITYPNTVDISVVYDDPGDSLTCAFVEPPVQVYPWESLPDAEFRVDETYLNVAPGPEAEPFFEVGDVVDLVDYGQQAGFAEINGEDYRSCGSTPECNFAFEEDLMLSGGCNGGYFDYSLGHPRHKEALEQMESVRLGGLMIDLMMEGGSIQIARCVEEDGKLRVVDVSTDRHYYEPVYLRKDEQGSWQALEPVWYIIHYPVDGEMMREFGRIACGIG